ncbi:hypothetical protein TNCT_605401 [Trichonephila clavata]|uniref:Uncharacterized protein n=1 Tax=Trichonephila clavata TaxID=2740835 RepID=A0A8X6HG49_TRICU|nr:hypothetical protein TNCT_605401 [Trichonephila clavata]
MTRDINRDEKEFCGIKFVGSLTARHRLLYYLFFWLMKQMAREDEAIIFLEIFDLHFTGEGFFSVFP